MKIFTVLSRIIKSAWTHLFGIRKEFPKPSSPTGPKAPISELYSQPSHTLKHSSASSVNTSLRMQISQKGIDLIKKHEGLHLYVYKDPVGYPTIGYGHLIQEHEDFKVITEEQAENLLMFDITSAKTCVNNLVKQELHQHEFDALVSFVFNVGCGNFKDSTLLKRINRREHRTDPEMVYIEWGRWVHANGVKLPGLERRRLEEGEYFRSGNLTKQVV